MRTVDQVASELNKAIDAEQAAKEKVVQLRNELQQILAAAQAALGVKPATRKPTIVPRAKGVVFVDESVTNVA